MILLSPQVDEQIYWIFLAKAYCWFFFYLFHVLLFAYRMCILIHMRLWKIKIFHNWKWSWKGEVIEPLNRLSSLRNKKLAIYLISSYESLWVCWADMKYFITAKIILFCPISCCENLFGYQLSFVSIIASHIQYPDTLTCKFRVSLVFMLTNHWVKLVS